MVSQRMQRMSRRAHSEDDDYRMRREKNNIAVRKSRDKNRRKNQQIVDKIEHLKQENTDLEQTIRSLAKELSLLKELLVNQATGGRSKVTLTSQSKVNVQFADPSSVQADHGYSRNLVNCTGFIISAKK